MTKNTRLTDWGLLLLCNFIWGSLFVVYKIVQQRLGPICAVFFPMTIAALLLTFFVRRQKAQEDKHRKKDAVSKD